jgi:hypothetical protein
LALWDRFPNLSIEMTGLETYPTKQNYFRLPHLPHSSLRAFVAFSEGPQAWQEPQDE